MMRGLSTNAFFDCRKGVPSVARGTAQPRGHFKAYAGIGGKIEAARAAAGYNRQQFARELGIPESTLHSWESNVSRIPEDRLTEIATTLDVDIESLTGEQE